MDADHIEAVLRALFEADPHGCSAVYLFGSVARGEDGPSSDVDVGVLFDQDPPLTLEGLGPSLERDLEKLLEHPVQIVVLDRAPADLIHRVLRDGRLVLDRDPARRIRFEVRMRNEYFDLLPHLERYRRVERVS